MSRLNLHEIDDILEKYKQEEADTEDTSDSVLVNEESEETTHTQA